MQKMKARSMPLKQEYWMPVWGYKAGEVEALGKAPLGGDCGPHPPPLPQCPPTLWNTKLAEVDRVGHSKEEGRGDSLDSGLGDCLPGIRS